LKKKVPYYSELKDFLAKIGSKLLVDTVNNLDTRRETAIPQDITQVTKAPKVQKEWAELDFVNMTAWQAEQINRAIGEDYPLHTLYKNKPHKNTKTPKVFSVQLRDLFLPTKRILLDAGDPPGTFTYDHHTETLQMVFRDGSVVACSHLQFENKKIIEAKDFANGYERFGRFGLDDMIVDEWIMKKNMKKRAKMIQYQPKGEN
jgi:methionyl-tRNA formyltransferase